MSNTVILTDSRGGSKTSCTLDLRRHHHFGLRSALKQHREIPMDLSKVLVVCLAFPLCCLDWLCVEFSFQAFPWHSKPFEVFADCWSWDYCMEHWAFFRRSSTGKAIRTEHKMFAPGQFLSLRLSYVPFQIESNILRRCSLGWGQAKPHVAYIANDFRAVSFWVASFIARVQNLRPFLERKTSSLVHLMFNVQCW